MKTNRFTLPISIFLSLILILSAENIFSQGRTGRSRNESSRSNTSEKDSRIASGTTRDRIAYSNSRNERTSYGYSRNGRNNQNSGNTYAYTPRNTQPQVTNNKNQMYSHADKKHPYEKHNGHHNYINVYSYHHPGTYNAWHFPAPWKYARHAIVFHHNHGNYFFHHGRFYQYHPSRGYYRVGVPAGLVFEYLPSGYKKIYIGGQLYYRYGEIFFEYSPWGYRIIPQPTGMIVTAHF